jgi:hypothetical protein
MPDYLPRGLDYSTAVHGKHCRRIMREGSNVAVIEGKNALHGVDVHDGDEPRVIDLDALQQNIRVNQDTHQCSRPSYMASRLTA